jgi:signal transduction histidine kinase
MLHISEPNISTISTNATALGLEDDTLVNREVAIAKALVRLTAQKHEWLNWLSFTNAMIGVLILPVSEGGAEQHNIGQGWQVVSVFDRLHDLSTLIGKKVSSPEFALDEFCQARHNVQLISSTGVTYGSGRLLIWYSTELEGNNPAIWFDVFNMALQQAYERESLEMALKQTEALSLAKSRFLSIMSYEIRTPMNAIMGMTELMLDTPLSAEQREYAQITYDSSEALLQILGDVVDYAKLEVSGIEMDYAPFAPRDTVANTLKMIAAKAQAKEIKINPAFEFGIPTVVLGDAGRLRQILLNLILSIIKFMRNGELLIRVNHIATTHEHVVLKFEIKSNHIQIPNGMRNILISPFIKNDDGDSRQYIGVRLAMSVAAKLVNKMGGELKIEPIRGGGWLFWFTATFGLQTTAP